MRKIWTDKEDELIMQLYPDTETNELCGFMNVTKGQLYDRASRLNIKKTEEYLKESGGRLEGLRGMNTRFKKGNPAWNKGMKGLNIGGTKTQFKKGNIPQTWRPVGSEQLREDGYLFIKIAEPNVWVQKHRLLWEKEYGPIPTGMIVKFRDKNRLNFDLSNLYLADRRQHMADNTIMRYPEDLRSTIKTLSKLTKSLKDYGKE